MSHYEIIGDEKELKWFFDNILPPLQKEEVYFVSLSARNKLLTKEEQKELNLGRTEMFFRQIIRERNWEKFLRKIKRFETSFGSYKTKNNSNIPNKAIVCYVNINPSDSLKAYKEFNKTMNEYLHELTICASRGRDMSNIISRINKQDRLLMNCYQKARGVKYWIDFDIDTPHYKEIEYVLQDFVEEVKERHGKAYIIQTRGGYHLLVSRDTAFDKEYNPRVILREANYKIARYLSSGVSGKLENIGYEIIQNNNEMLPLPGLFQGDFLVKVINKE